tara:strand:- start:10842 stop:11585 length:744 start_codon:yes stop_codon:yes gene_type:complete
MRNLSDQMIVVEKYKSTLKPLASHELQQLEDNILAEGGFTSPILYHLSEDGQCVVVDGHHRLGIAEKHKDNIHLEQPGYCEVIELSGASESDVVKWIKNHQKGRRNDPTLWEKYELGKEFLEARETGQTSIEFAAEKEDVTPSQVRHAADLAEAVDEAEEKLPGFKDQYLGDEKASARAVKEAAVNLDKPEPSPLMAFAATQKMVEKLSRAVFEISKSFHESPEVIEKIRQLGVELRKWEDECAKEV